MDRTPHRPHQRPPSRGGPQNRFRPRSPAERRPDSLWIYGIHPVLAALANPRRKVLQNPGNAERA